ncbi:putative U-box domain-containing protein 42 isoform X2 [Andrographis paniculata]|uniref:putative U-box domain-containing protein 42 isoform X2 n=1 Tax=Andrographis paniculata TaxID=175694 RepID=UPI0021E73105|nr:putative U-box domain-containing protein 42 isoform X2 [Andrographis paniculata]
MSTSSTEWSQLMEDRNPVGSLTQSLIAAISDIIRSVVCIKIQKDVFTEIGCYFYRASLIIMELNINWSTPTNTIEMLQLLSKRVELAKGFAKNLEKNVQSSEVKTIVRQLEGVLRSIGENLGMIPLTMFGEHEFAEMAAKSLSKDMKDVSFALSPSRSFDVREKFPTRSAVGEGKRRVEKDLYSVDVEVSSMNEVFSDTSTAYSVDNQERSPRRFERFGSKSAASSLMAIPQLAQYMEPLYDTFFCPLTKRVMEDPVTVETGVTYEREAITEWFNQAKDPESITCPKSSKTMTSRAMSANVALKATIDEWKERNEAARIKVARAALSLASTDNMVLEAINDMKAVCRSKPYNKVQVRSSGIVPLLGKFLEYRSRSIRLGTLELVRQLAEDDDEGKDDIARTIDASIVIKLLSSSHQPIRHASASLLLELSKSPYFCTTIGTVTGGILMLITIKYKQSVDAFASETAEAILTNLASVSKNVKLMAENGHWEPLLTRLLEGDEEMRIEMASYLAEIVLGPDNKTYVAERASPALIQMVQSGNSVIRNAALKALKKISCHHPNAEILVEAGIMQTMVEEMFSRTIHNEPTDSKTEAAEILANILESGMDLENVRVSTHGHTMASDYIVYNIIHRIKHSSPDELNINLVRMLLCLIKFHKASGTIVSVVKETEASYNLIELINTTDDELSVASLHLLIALSGFMGHTLSDRLCKTKGLPENLIDRGIELTRITEKHAVSRIGRGGDPRYRSGSDSRSAIKPVRDRLSRRPRRDSRQINDDFVRPPDAADGENLRLYGGSDRAFDAIVVRRGSETVGNRARESIEAVRQPVEASATETVKDSKARVFT